MKNILKSQFRVKGREGTEFLLFLYRFVADNDLCHEDGVATLVSATLDYYDEKQLLPSEATLTKITGVDFTGITGVADEDTLVSQARELESKLRNELFKDSCLKAVTETTIEKKKFQIEQAYSYLNRTASQVVTYPTMAECDFGALLKTINSKEKGLLTGIQRADDVIQGIMPGTLTTVFAAPGHFKSTFCYNLAYYNSVKCGYNCLFITLEIPKDDVIINMVSRFSYDEGSPIPAEVIKKGNLTDKEQANLTDLFKRYQKQKKGDITVLDQSDLFDWNPVSFGNFLDELQDKTNFDFLILDYIQRLKHVSVKGMDYKELANAIISVLQSKTIGCGKAKKKMSVILCSQAKREGIERADRTQGTYAQTDGAELNNLERDSYYIFSLWSTEDMRNNGNTNYQLLKHRGGITLADVLNVSVEPQCFVFGDNLQAGEDDTYMAGGVASPVEFDQSI